MTERIFCFGDSNTWGYAPGDLMMPRYPRETRWPGVLARLSGREVIEAGLCGRTAAFDDPDINDEEQKKMRLFSFITLLSYDVYVKKLLIEKILDNMTENDDKPDNKKEKKTKDKK